MSIRRASGGIALLVFLAAVAVIARLLVERPLGGSLHFAWPGPEILRLRTGAVLAGLTIGAALGVSGAMLQALLRNPLAEPFLLGGSSGAGLGVMLATYVAYATGEPAWTSFGAVLPASIGAIGALLVVMALGHRREGLDPLSLVLAGVIVSAMCGAGIMFLQQVVPHGLRGDLVVWMMGRVPEAPPRVVLAITAAVTLAGVLLGVVLGRAMDAATLGDDEARSVGVKLWQLRLVLLIASGALAAAAVALAGPLAFVGLIAPHVTRSLAGARHAALVLGSALAGAALVVGADTVRQALEFGGGRLPVGVLTAALGGPLFLWLLHRGPGGAAANESWRF